MKQLIWAATLAGLVGIQAVAIAAEAPKNAQAPAKATTSQSTEFAVVSVKQKEVMRLAASGDHSAMSRAEMVRKRLHQLLEPAPNTSAGPFKPSDFSVETSDNMPVVRFRNSNVIYVTPQDAKLANQPAGELAQTWANGLRDAVSGVKLSAKEDLPEDFVTFVSGRMNAPSGGGAGGTPPEKPKDKNKDKK